MNADIIKEYNQIANDLKELKKKEADMRVQILQDLFPNAGSGTLSASVGDFVVKGTFRYTPCIDAKLLNEMMEHLTPDEVKCFSFKPSLSLTNYKKLKNTKLIDECITFKPAMPSIVIKTEV